LADPATVEQGDRQAEGGGRLTDSTTPAQRLNAAHRQIDKLTDEVATLQKAAAAQNQATASIQREWRMWSDALLRIHTPEGVDAAKWLAAIST